MRSVARSEQDLQILKSSILAQLQDLDDAGVALAGVGIDIVRNAVHLRVKLDAQKESILAGRYGSAVVLEAATPTVFDTCSSMNYCWPLKGGLRIYPTEETAAKCTLGFLGRRNDTNAMVALTAGHCIALGGDGVDDKWGHSITPPPSALFGGEIGHTWTNYADADVGLIQLNSGAVSALADKNQILIEEPNSVSDVTVVRSNASQTDGTPVCRMGWGSAYGEEAIGESLACGQIDAPIDETQLSEGKWIDHTWTVDFDSKPGDSGGPIFLPVQGSPPYVLAFGTHVDSETGTGANNGWYSPINWGITAYDALPTRTYTYHLCVDTDC
jgi:hypothetical protein